MVTFYRDIKGDTQVTFLLLMYTHTDHLLGIDLAPLGYFGYMVYA
jgi:hypothetical protein